MPFLAASVTLAVGLGFTATIGDGVLDRVETVGSVGPYVRAEQEPIAPTVSSIDATSTSSAPSTTADGVPLDELTLDDGATTTADDPAGTTATDAEADPATTTPGDRVDGGEATGAQAATADGASAAGTSSSTDAASATDASAADASSAAGASSIDIPPADTPSADTSPAAPSSAETGSGTSTTGGTATTASTGPTTTARPGATTVSTGRSASTAPVGTSSTTATTATTAAPTTAPTTTTRPPTTAAPAPPPTTGGQAPGTGKRVLYVDGDNGYAHNPGTEAQPFRRPIEATSIALPGDTIYLRGGTYDTATHGAFKFTRSGTAQNWIRIAPYPGEQVTLVSGGEWGSAFEVLGASYVEVSGFIMRGRNDSIHGVGVHIKDGAHDVRVTGNRISNFGGAGISLVGASKVTIDGNDVRDNAMRSHYQGSGITLYKPSGPVASGGAYSLIVRNNYVVHNYNAVRHHDGRLTDGNCIIMDRFDEVGYPGRTLVENNVCAENGGRGVHSYRSSNILARNNTLYHNMGSAEVTAGRGEMTVGEARNVLFVNNLVINRPGVASYVDNDNVNSQFLNNWVASGPPPGDTNRLLPGGPIFPSTTRGGPVTQWRPLASAGLAGTADGGRQTGSDLTGRSRPNPGAVGALEP